MRRRIAIALSFSLFAPTLAQAKPAMRAAAPSPSVNASLDEIRRSFKLDGKPIPPEIFRDMGDGDMADSGAILVSVDVKAAIGSNLYYDDITANNEWFVQKKIDKEAMNGWEETGYRYVGATSNKLLAVIASYNGGGSGTFYTLHILDLAAAKAFDSEGKVYDRLNVTTLREVPLGDRWEGEAKISGNVVEIVTTRKGPADDSGARTTERIEARRP